MSFTCQFTKRHIPATARADLAWWSTYAESWNGVHLLQKARPTLHVHTDASGTKGIGSTFGANWYTSCVPQRLCHAHIQVKELYAVLQALLHWGEHWRGVLHSNCSEWRWAVIPSLDGYLELSWRIYSYRCDTNKEQLLPLAIIHS